MKNRIACLFLSVMTISSVFTGVAFAEGGSNKSPQAADTYAIFGSDNRVKVKDTTEKGSNAICNLTIQFPSKRVYGTGFVYSDLTVGTAGHCIYDIATDTYATQITIVPGDSTQGGLDKAIIKDEKNMHVLTEFKDTHDWIYDYGCITLDEPFSSKVEPLSLNKSYLKEDYKTEYLTLSGYDIHTAQLYKQRSNKLVTDVSNYDVSFKFDTLPGMSGSPIYNDDYEVVAIYNYGPNSGLNYVPEDYTDGYNTAQIMNSACYNYLMSFVE